MGDSLLERAREYRDLVLLAEVGAWLHDLGKLSDRFVPGAGTRWHHEGMLAADVDSIPPAVLSALNRPLTGPSGWLGEPGGNPLGADETSMAAMIAEHHAGPGRTTILRLLIDADHDDSGEDEYNANESVPHSGPVQMATVFGMESARPQGLDAKRHALYGKIAEKMQPGKTVPKMRSALWPVLQPVLAEGLGKTARAANDIRLDQHVWGVASRFKTFLMRELLWPSREETGAQKAHVFRLLSVQWDSWQIVAPQARLSDVVGRAELLREVRDDLRALVEEEYAIGNRIYEDDDGIHFMVADVPYGDELEGLIRTRVDELTDGEVMPIVTLSETTERVTDLVVQMGSGRKAVPEGQPPAWARGWFTDTASKEPPQLCTVCQRRPAERNGLCGRCFGWRGKGHQAALGEGRERVDGRTGGRQRAGGAGSGAVRPGGLAERRAATFGVRDHA